MNFITSGIRSEGLFDTYSFRTDSTFILPPSNSTYFMSTSNPYVNVFDGTSTNYVAALPNATLLQIGHEYYIANESTTLFAVTPNDNTNALTYLYPRVRGHFILNNNSTSTGEWLYETSSANGGAAGYSVFGSYTGNANTGRYLEIYPGTDSNEAPYIVIGSLAIIAITIGASALSTGTVSIYKKSNLSTPIVSISLNNQSSATLDRIFYQLSANDGLAMKVSSGTISKPYVTAYLTFAG